MMIMKSNEMKRDRIREKTKKILFQQFVEQKKRKERWKKMSLDHHKNYPPTKSIKSNTGKVRNSDGIGETKKMK